MRLRVNSLKPVEIAIAVGFGDRAPTSEWRGADNAVEPGLVPTEYLRELDLPVERVDTLRAFTQSLFLCARSKSQVPFTEILAQLREQSVPFELPLPISFTSKESSDNQIARKPHQL